MTMMHGNDRVLLTDTHDTQTAPYAHGRRRLLATTGCTVHTPTACYQRFIDDEAPPVLRSSGGSVSPGSDVSGG